MGFLQSAINQVGRDMGRVVSNAVFKDRHSIPIRRARSIQSEQRTVDFRQGTSRAQPIKQVQSDFDKAISFKTGFKPETLISKLGGAFVVIKNEARAFIDDGYLDIEESQQLVNMIRQFNSKCSDIEDVISFTEDEDSKVYKQLDNIHKTTISLYKEVLEISAQACLKRAAAYESEAKNITTMSFGRFLGLHLLWMPKYAKGGEKNTTKAVIANILDIITLTFPITRIILLIVALSSYSGETKKAKETQQGYLELAEQERQRASTYQKFIES
jgi:hypothetical protein